MSEIALEALTNARDLFDDGVMLYERQRISSAFTLIGLAADELGKHILVASFYGAREEKDEEWKNFWKRFRRHQEKLGNTLFAAWAGDLFSDDSPPDADAFHKRRLTATYVDIDDNGLVLTPRARLDESDVARDIERIGSELAFCESVLRGATPSSLAATFESIRTSERSADFRRQVSQLGTLALTGITIAARAGLSQSEICELLSVLPREDER